MKEKRERLSFKQKFIGDKAFYRRVLYIAVPIMIQNAISNFVGMLDNIMVGRLGTEAMSGVSIVNQLVFVYFLCMFGGCAGAGIYTAQFYGKGDEEGIRNTFRFKIWIMVGISVAATAIFLLFGKELIGLYLNGSEEEGDLALAASSGWEYLKIILLSMPFFMVLQVYASTLRECGETVLTMKAGLCAVFVNLIFNYLLIYGKFGFPELGVKGAAYATMLSRAVEMSIVVVWTHVKKEKNPYIVGMYRTLKVPLDIAKNCFFKGLPLLVNETLWATGVAILTQAYSTRGLNVVAGINIVNTINNVFNVVFIAMGDTVAIIIGQLLGAGKLKEARDTDNKLIFFSVSASIVTALMMACVSPFFPMLYDTSDAVKTLATEFIIAQAIFMPQAAFMHASYFTLRSGGKTIVTFLFDSVFMLVVSVPLGFALSRFTDIPALWILVFVQMADWIKCAIGFILVKKGIWIQNLVTKEV